MACPVLLCTALYCSVLYCTVQVYDEKSDIWALGCILYEMAALQKTFEGSNLPALVNKIMKGQFAPIRGNYTPLFKQLVRWELGSFSLHVILNPQLTLMCSRDLLQRDPEFRPSAAELLLSKLPGLTVERDIRYSLDIVDIYFRCSTRATTMTTSRAWRRSCWGGPGPSPRRGGR